MFASTSAPCIRRSLTAAKHINSRPFYSLEDECEIFGVAICSLLIPAYSGSITCCASPSTVMKVLFSVPIPYYSAELVPFF